MAEISDLNVVDASNTARWPEGMAPSEVNDAGRADEGILARWFNDWNGSVVASGSSNAYAITSNRTIAALANNTIMWWRANHTNTGAATLALNGLTAKDIVRATGAALTAGDITSGQIVGTYYNSTLDDWVLITPAVQGTASESATGLIELATAAEVEALDSSRAVRASTMHRHPGVAKSAGRGASAGGITGTAYNVASITRNSTGNYTVAFTTALADANFAPIITARDASSGNIRVASWDNPTTAGFDVLIRNNAGTVQDCDFAFVVLGDM
jgi:hypothetical protein